MTAFNLDFSKVQQRGEVKDGTYEAVVNKVVENATPSGSEFIDIELIIRNDVQQQFQNSHLFPKVWKGKKDNKYNMGMVMAIAQALGLEDGKTYNGLEEFFSDMVLKPVRVTVKNEESNGYRNTNVKRWEKTNTTGPVNHQFKNGDEPSFGPDRPTVTVQKDDLPF